MVNSTDGCLVTLGEVLLRLSPPRREVLLQSPTLDVWVGGSEANVATQLAVLGNKVRIASRVPDNDLGHAAIAKLRGYGVDVSGILLGGDRMGLYFATPGAGRRPTEVFYDRAFSSFSEATAEGWDWDQLLAGAARLHLSGITPALGATSADLAIAAADAAVARGVRVSFDGNWRGKLWSAWEGNPREILARIVSKSDILFGNHRDISLLLGQAFEGDEHERKAALAAFEAFPGLELIASTRGETPSADQTILGARLDTRESALTVPAVSITGVLDRIGRGDAFVAGMLSGLSLGDSHQTAAERGLALAVLKHWLPGDASFFSVKDIDAYWREQFDVVR